MRKIILISAAIFAYCILHNAYCFSQGTAINDNGASADNSAILDVSSSSQGLLIPRMTELNRVNIPAPATGLMVYQTDVAAGFYYFNGSAWTFIGADNLGNHTASDSLNMSMNKIVNLATCTYNYDAANKLYVDNKVGAGGGGYSFPTMISDESPAAYTFRDAVYFCDTLTQDGYSDWYMPTYSEFWYVLCKHSNTVTNPYSSNYVWLRDIFMGGSSSEFECMRRLSDGYGYADRGYGSHNVRCVR